MYSIHIQVLYSDTHFIVTEILVTQCPEMYLRTKPGKDKKSEIEVGDDIVKEKSWVKCLKCFKMVWKNVGNGVEFCKNGDQ